MPKSTPSDVPHVTATDHYIRVVDKSPVETTSLLSLVDPHSEFRAEDPIKREIAEIIALVEASDLKPGQFKGLDRNELESRLTTLLTLEPEHTEALIVGARLAENRRDYSTSATYLERAFALSPESPKLKLSLAYALAQNGEHIAAEGLITDLPNGVKRDQKFGQTLAKLAQHNMAPFRSTLEELAAITPPIEEVILTLAANELEKNQSKRALRLVEKSLKQDPFLPKVLFLAANLSYDRREYARSLVYLNRSIRLNPDLDSAVWLKARTLEKLGQKLNARALFKRLVKRNGDEVEIVGDFVRHLVEAGLASEARTSIERSSLSKEERDALKERYGLSH